MESRFIGGNYSYYSHLFLIIFLSRLLISHWSQTSCGDTLICFIRQYRIVVRVSFLYLHEAQHAFTSIPYLFVISLTS